MIAMSSIKKIPEPLLTYLVLEAENISLDQVFDSLFEAVINSSNNGCDSVIIDLNEQIKTEGK